VDETELPSEQLTLDLPSHPQEHHGSIDSISEPPLARSPNTERAPINKRLGSKRVEYILLWIMLLLRVYSKLF